MKKEKRRRTHRDEGAESFNSHSSWPGQRGGRRFQAVGPITFVDPRLLHGDLPFSLEPGIRQVIRFSRFYVDFSRSVLQFRWHGSSADLLKIFYIVYICVFFWEYILLTVASTVNCNWILLILIVIQLLNEI